MSDPMARPVKKRKLEPSFEHEPESGHDGDDIKVVYTQTLPERGQRRGPAVTGDATIATPPQLPTPVEGTPRQARSKSSQSRIATPSLGGNSSASLSADANNAFVINEDLEFLDDQEVAEGIARAKRTFNHVRVYPLALPSACFECFNDNHEPVAPVTCIGEAEAIAELATLLPEDPAEEYTYLELDEFTIYHLPDTRQEYDMCTLDRLRTHRAANRLSFDGILSVGDRKIPVRDLKFGTVTVDGYGDEGCVDLRGQICIQSDLARRYKLWYRLGRSSPEYQRFHDLYLWLATFAKYFVDYLMTNAHVTIKDFRSRFFEWLQARFGRAPEFQIWHAQCDCRTDFSTSVAAHVNYLHKECSGVEQTLLQHPLWGEVDPERLTAIERSGTVKSESDTQCQERTVVTPAVYRSFRHMYFGFHLQMEKPKPGCLADTITSRKQEMCLTPWDTPPTCAPTAPDYIIPVSSARSVIRGDVVLLEPDDGRSRSTAARWYAYVLEVRMTKDDTVLDLLWLFQASDTTLRDAYYPYANELFLSDSCNCGKDAYPIERAKGIVDVTWFATNSHEVSGFFVRQKYRSKDSDQSDFVTLKSGDFKCQCMPISDYDDCEHTYRIGDTVLVLPRNSSSLLPARIVEFDRSAGRVRVSKFFLAKEYDSGARPNELQVGEEELSLKPNQIVRKFKLKTFNSRDDVAMPYLRSGSGDCFYAISVRSTTDDVSHTLSSVRDGDGGPRHRQPMTGLGLFCGGGNFDRGLEDGGAAHFKYAVDWDAKALHSYRANVREPEDTHYFLGSVNDYLLQALLGSCDVKIARVGNILIISAGSPCPGFSVLQLNKESQSSTLFASMVASVVSFVDVYSPQYLVLENVVNMTSNIRIGDAEQNVFAQILAALVALGYQAQQFLGDSWSHASSQHRSRVFIVARAPGLKPLASLPISHDHPPDTKVHAKGLAKTSAGVAVCTRRNDYTPFPHVSAQQATADLPDIGDSVPQVCPQFPDHRTPSDEGFESRQRISRLPVHPHGMGIAKSIDEKIITSGEAKVWFGSRKPRTDLKHDKAYTRLRPGGLFPTFTTDLNIQDARAGHNLHWEQPRTLTIMEVKRAFGYQDDDVLVGVRSDQMRILGNSVDRNAAFVLGLAIQDSWDAGSDGGAEDEPRLQASESPSAADVREAFARDDCESTPTSTATDEIKNPALASVLRERQAIRAGGFSVINKMLNAQARVGMLDDDEETESSRELEPRKVLPEHSSRSSWNGH